MYKLCFIERGMLIDILEYNTNLNYEKTILKVVARRES